MKELTTNHLEEKMSNLQYRIAVTLSGCVIACSTVLAVLEKIDAERYTMIALSLVAYWLPPPKNDNDKANKD